jgi:hypothetical protein
MFLCSPLIETAERNTCIRVKVNPKFLANFFFLLINVGHKLNSLSLSFSMAKDVDMKESQVLYEKHIHLHGLCAWLDKNMVPNTELGRFDRVGRRCILFNSLWIGPFGRTSTIKTINVEKIGRKPTSSNTYKIEKGTFTWW